MIENLLGEYEFSPAYDLLNTAIVIADDNEDSALTINGRKRKISLNDFDALAASLKINNKSTQAIYARLNKILPKWIACINKSFLSKHLKKAYIEILQKKHDKLFV